MRWPHAGLLSLSCRLGKVADARIDISETLSKPAIVSAVTIAGVIVDPFEYPTRDQPS